MFIGENICEEKNEEGAKEHGESLQINRLIKPLRRRQQRKESWVARVLECSTVPREFWQG